MPSTSSSSNTTIVVFSSSAPSSSPVLWTVAGSSYSLLRIAAVLLVFSITGVALRRAYLHRLSMKRLSATRRLKQEQLAQQVAAVRAEDGRELTLLSEQERRILSLSACELVAAVQKAELSSHDVLLALIRQALRVHDRCNVITEACFASALSHSRELDAAQAAGQPLGPLHGLPVSVKDSVGVAGLDCTLGVCRYAGQPWPADCLLVRLLRSRGAQLYVKSNIPQTLISFECCNPLFGVSTHLQSAEHTPGGSSGGEVTLIAGGGSVLGIGTDIGGSLRIPAHFSGTYALKPTSRRVSMQGFRASVPGQEGIAAAAGPMAMRVDDLVLLMRELLVDEAWQADSELVPLPLDMKAVQATGKLRIGYYVDDGFVPPSPPCARAVTETVAALQAAGHTLVPFSPPRMTDCISLYYALMAADGARTMTDQLKGEQREGYVTALATAVNIPGWVKRIIAAVLRGVLKEPVAAQLLLAARPVTVNALWKLQAARKAYRQEFFSQYREQRLDALLSPCHVLPAVKHGEYKKVSFSCSFTMAYNLLDAPAGVCPVSRVRADERWTGEPRHLLEKEARRCYDPAQTAGMPVGVQVAAAPYADETVLRVMKEIERLKPWTRSAVEF